MPRVAVIFLALLCGCAHQAAIQDHELCPGIRVHGRISPGLSATEKRLVCGDPKVPAWSSLPLWQAEYDLRNFLEQRGFYNPKFIKSHSPEKRPTVVVDLGKPTRVTSLTAIGAPVNLDLGRKRFVVGAVLTPDLLSQVEGWTGAQLKNQGYPCPKVKGAADPNTGEIRLRIKPGPKQNVTRVTEEMIPGLDSGVLRRFDAFGFGDPYDENLLSLTSLRITRQGLFDSAYFISECSPDGAVLHEHVVVGPPRLLSFGIGADTEGLIIGRASWSNTRWGRRANDITASVYGSTKEQIFDGNIDWYAFGATTRTSLRPNIHLLHDNEKFFEIAQATAQMGLQHTWEWHQSRGNLITGPQFQQIHTFRGSGPPNSRFLMLANELDIMSHDFELYLTEPRKGFEITLTADLSLKNVVSTVTAQRLGVRYEGLWNFRNYDPPLLVFGIRGSLDTTLTPGASSGGASQVPPNFTYFLGGSRDLRGFGRLSLPGNGVGGLSSAFTDFETRWVKTLPFSLEPFVFMDVGAIGPLPATLRLPVYYSPGFGMRWAPPFGAFRATLARGYPLDAPGGWQFYFSFGEEF